MFGFNNKTREQLQLFWRDYKRTTGYFVRNYKRELFIILLLTLITSAASLINPYLTRYIIDDIIIPQKSGKLESLLIILITVALVVFIVNFLLRFVIISTSEYFAIDLKKNILKSIFHFPLPFFNQKNSGKIIYNVFFDCESIDKGVIDSITSILFNFFTASFALAYMLYLSPFLSTCIVIGTLLQIIVIVSYAKPIAAKSRAFKKKKEEVMGVITDAFDDITVYKNTRTELSLLKKVHHGLLALRKRVLAYVIYFRSSSNISGFIDNIVYFAILWLGAKLMFQGQLSMGTLFAFISLNALFSPPLLAIVRFFLELPNVFVSFSRYFELINQRTEIPLRSQLITNIQELTTLSPQETRQQLQSTWNIKLNNVNFGYEKEKNPIFLDCNFTIPSGKRIAIYGESGSGKSTLINLILNYYQPQDGFILINDRNIQELDLKTLREHIFILPQVNSLITGSVKENIILGLKKGSKKEGLKEGLEEGLVEESKEELEGLQKEPSYIEMQSALTRALAPVRLFQKEDNLETLIGNRISELSYGEMKRVALARLFLNDPSLIILDEPTAGIDKNTCNQILTNIKDSFPYTTTIIFTHSKSVIPYVDDSYLIQKGKIELFSPLS